MISIKKIGFLVILSVLFFTAVCVEAESGSYGFSLSPAFGFLYGQSDEIVYKYPGRDLYQSLLIWDLKPLVYAGLKADFGQVNPFEKNGFFGELSFKIGLPLRTGTLEDWDWFNNKADYSTHFSRHDAFSRNAILSDVSAGYSWRLNDFIALCAFGEFSFMHFSWSARDGYAQYPPGDNTENYPPWNENLPKFYLSGEVLVYTQDWFIISPGLSLEWNNNHLFSLKGLINYSPLIYCIDRDDHLLRNITYWDYLYFGHYFKVGGEFSFTPDKNLEFSLAVSYKYITGPRGYTTVGRVRYNDSAGVGYSCVDLGLATKILIYGREKR
jgi:outer membrane protease